VFLNLFADCSPGPAPRDASGVTVDPKDKSFTAFAFKIQANMDKKHRDRIAFFRICSGKFERGMKVKHVRLGRDIRLAYANQFMAGDRETVDEAFPGDIIGVIDPGNIRIGDTISQKKSVSFDAIPRFSPEHFARVSIKDPLKRKQLQKGLMQLAEEGTVQLFHDPLVGPGDPILGVVGELQFDVLLHRLVDEYKLEVRLDRLPYSVARWPVTEEGVPPEGPIEGNVRMFADEDEKPVVLLEQEWDVKWLEKENPTLKFNITGFA
jgi:peptide chain release factor 3